MNEQVKGIISHKAFIPSVVGVAAFGVGVGMGYILGRRNRVHEYVVHDEPEKVPFDYDKMEAFISEREREMGVVRPEPDVVVSIKELYKEGPRSPIVRVGEDFVERKIGERLPTMAPDPAVEQRTIFAENNDDWDYDVELENRSEEAPFVIHRDEFYAQETDYTQATLTYYAGDDILVDEDDTPIYNHPTVIGELKFGHGSGDPNVFHVRNDKRKGEYEVIYDPGFYAVEVLGLAAEDIASNKELKHTGVRKFRLDE